MANMVTYYMPKRLRKDVEALAKHLNIKITKIKEEGNDIRLYVIGPQKLIDEFNEVRLAMLGTKILGV